MHIHVLRRYSYKNNKDGLDLSSAVASIGKLSDDNAVSVSRSFGPILINETGKKIFKNFLATEI